MSEKSLFKLPTNVFNFVRDNVSIKTVVDEFVDLKQDEYYWKGKCPFCDEERPRFQLDPYQRVYYCFACEHGGDVITFVAQKLEVGEKGAVYWLADKFNLKIPTEFKEKEDA